MTTTPPTRMFWLLALLFCLAALPARAEDTQGAALHILDYMAVDYPGSVRDGHVVKAGEYQEQREFAGQVHNLISRLPAHPQQPELRRKAQQLVQAVEARAAGPDVALLAKEIYAGIISAYAVETAPRRAPDLEPAGALFQANCAGCHGPAGRGDGPQGADLDPKPANFHDAGRQRQRSVYSLYNTITQGVEGTAMRAFTTLDENQRWALAFYVSNFLALDAQPARGQDLWQQDRFRALYPNLKAVAVATPDDVARHDGPDGLAVLAYLRHHPQAASGSGTPLQFARDQINKSIDLYRQGQSQAAYDTAVAAYLEGYELAETGLASVDRPLKEDIEHKMMAYRQAIKAGTPVDTLAAHTAELERLLIAAEDRLHARTLSPAMAATSAFIILAREGLEAILVLAAIVAFLVKTNRRDTLPYIHAGWISALALGLLTWFVASEVITITGASREVTEGVTALVAAAMLLYVGYWLHNNMHTLRWKHFIQTKVQSALAGRALWVLVGISFLAVYREVFETVLFYQTLWLQAGEGGTTYLIAGMVAGAATLGAIAWAIFRFSIRLPLRLVFAVNSALLYILAVVFAGKGVAALQAAGKLPSHPINFPTIDMLGIYPNLQALGLQALLLAAAVVWLAYSHARDRHAEA